MKYLVRTTLFVLAIVGLGNQQAHSAAVPAILTWQPFTSIVYSPKSGTGPDGNNRFLWDYFNITTSTYQGSALWILDPTGNVIGSGDTLIPASVGGSAGPSIFSNTLLHVNSDNSTTVAFVFLGSSGVNAFGTWTYNAQGKLIAFSGPTGFSGLQVSNIGFQRDFLVVTFIPAGQPVTPTAGVGPYTVWLVDHFGNVVSAVGPQGPYTDYVLGSISIPSSATLNQLWHWLFISNPGPSEGINLAVQEFSPTGAALSGFNYGPF